MSSTSNTPVRLLLFLETTIMAFGGTYPGDENGDINFDGMLDTDTIHFRAEGDITVHIKYVSFFFQHFLIFNFNSFRQ